MTALQFKAMKRHTGPVHTLVIHHTGDARDLTVEDIHAMHLARGWSGIGYHGIIDRSGELHKGRPLEYQGAGVRGHNDGAWHLALNGSGMFTRAQWETLRHTVTALAEMHYPLTIKGHNDLAETLCPGFEVSDWLAHGMAPVYGRILGETMADSIKRTITGGLL